MDENRVGIKIYTIIFFLILAGFIGFLIYEYQREADFKERTAPKERFKKNKGNSMKLLIEQLSNKT